MKPILTSLAIFLIQGVAYSQTDKCANPSTQMEMNGCALKKYEAADLELNKKYKKILSIIEPERKAQFISTQKIWISYKEAHCKFYEKQYEGGSIMPLMRYTCLESITNDRIKEMKEMISHLDL